MSRESLKPLFLQIGFIFPKNGVVKLNTMGKKDKTYTFIDLFAGLGGFNLALSQLGCKCVFASELKEDLRTLYGINFPGIPTAGDITKLDLDEVPQHEILCAGFPCQPFSQAGKREGFEDSKKRGNLFDYICAIIEKRRPEYVFLENVSNLKGHNEGKTWNTIKTTLEETLQYHVAEPVILSPHQFGIPQHRRRIYIVCRDKHVGDLTYFKFPPTSKKECDISGIIDTNDTNFMRLKPETRHQLNVWQEFIDQTVSHGQPIPSFPIWAMEFGANYPFRDKAPYLLSTDELRKYKGRLGQSIKGLSHEECMKQLPIYSQTNTSKEFPDWKIKYIQQNRDFYEKNKEWLDDWIQKVSKFENSHLKMEWNCGTKAKPIIEDKIVQFRASGIRIKKPTYSPALNLVGTQVPIFPWIKIPKELLKDGEPDKGRYMSLNEAAKLQGMENLKFKGDNFTLSICRSFEALGNAVNVNIVKKIAENLLEL